MRLAVLLLAACGSSTAPPTTTRVKLVSPGASPDDVVVATVNGRDVWGSCVARQAVGGKDRRVALEECIDFELMAQLAEDRALATDPEVTEAARTAAIDRLVQTQYEDKFTKPSDFGRAMDKIVDERDRYRHRPELRASTYLRVTATPPSPDKTMAQNDPRDGDAKRIADTLAQRLVGETGLLSASLEEAAVPLRDAAAAKGLAIEHADVPLLAYAGLEKSYADVLYALPEIGRAGGPVRTKWGYDIILWTSMLPPREQTREELALEIFPGMRREYFAVWVGQLVRDRGTKIEYVEANLPRLEDIQ